QGRGGKGSNSAKLVEDDFIKQMFIASTHDYLTFITTVGKAYWLKAHEIPENGRNARGTHIKSLLEVSPNEEIAAVVSFKEVAGSQYLFMATAAGVVKKVAVSEFRNAKTRGIMAIKLDEGDRLVTSVLSTGSGELVLITRHGQALRITETEVRPMGRASHGVAGIRLAAGDELTGALRVEDGSRILVVSEYGCGKRVGFDEFSVHGRGTGGQRIYNVTPRTGELVGAIALADSDEVVCITSQGKTLRLPAESIAKQGRAASGVRVLEIEPPDMVIGVDKIVGEE
ncbi:MAG: DNA gyrase subunit A, partial [Treponema sp.]|nr:DNA gyrase subunit A [Treponema sp.]